MSSYRFQIVNTIAGEHEMTLDDLAAALPGQKLQQLRDNLGKAKQEGLLAIFKDITGAPAYRLTAAGKDWLAAQVAAKAAPQAVAKAGDNLLKSATAPKAPPATKAVAKVAAKAAAKVSAKVTKAAPQGAKAGAAAVEAPAVLFEQPVQVPGAGLTPAGGGDVTPAPVDRATSQSCTALPGEAMGVVEPLPADDAPLAGGSDEMGGEVADFVDYAHGFAADAMINDANEKIAELEAALERAAGELRYVVASVRKALEIEGDPAVGIVPSIEALIKSNNDWRGRADALDVDKSNLLQASYKANELNDQLREENRAMRMALMEHLGGPVVLPLSSDVLQRDGGQVAASADATPPTAAGYVVMREDIPDMIVHPSLASAKAEAQQLLMGFDPSEESALHVVALMATAKLSVVWQTA